MFRACARNVFFPVATATRRLISSASNTGAKLPIALESMGSSRSIDLFCVKRNGDVYKENVSVKELLRKTRLHARDLLPLEGDGLGRSASIQPREQSIVVGVSHVRSIITTDEMYLFYPNSFAVQHFVEALLFVH